MATTNDLTGPSPEALRQELGFSDSIYDHFWSHYGHCQQWVHRHFVVLKELSMLNEVPSTSNQDEMQLGSDSESDNDDNFEEEITPELLEFMRISQDHRKERDRQKIEEEMKAKSTNKTWFVDDQNTYEMADKVTIHSSSKEITTLPPQVQIGAKLRQEMQNLYGDRAVRIQSLEALMQMKFDEIYDKSHPPLWPNIPLKL